jgi:hypothetical protein
MPIELNFKIHFPEFYILEEYEAKLILKQFVVINNAIVERRKIEAKIEEKRREIKNRMKYKR